MKIKLWQFEYDFDKDDAKIVIPVLLVALGLAFTPLNKSALWSGAIIYYASYFFLKPFFTTLNDLRSKFHFRCPYCKSRDIIYQGMNNYYGDVPYDWYRCNHCGETSILLNNDRLVKPGPGRGVKELKTGA
jgi:DNA-directed RNA polymerase subunit RPC12/RpoP